MEMDELKNMWLSLDERLKKQELLKESILKGILRGKSDRALHKLVTSEILGGIQALLLIPILLFLIYQMNFHLIYVVAVCAFIGYAFSQLWKIYTLKKVDYSQPISKNIKLAQSYNIYIKREKTVMLILIPMIIFFTQYTSEMAVWKLLSLIAILIILTLFAYWEYKKIYDKNISSILNNLEELKELDEEKE